MPVLNVNQFAQGPVVGQLDLVTNPNPSVMTVRYNDQATITNEIIPGEGAKLVDLGANDSVGPPIVDERTADADAIFGVKISDTKQNTVNPGAIFEIAGKGGVIWMNANAAILRGAKVALVLATPGNVVTLGAEEQYGIALDKAAGADTLLRVQITAEGWV